MFGDNDTSEDLHQSSSQIHQALDVYRKISDLLGHPEKIQLVTDPPSSTCL